MRLATTSFKASSLFCALGPIAIHLHVCSACLLFEQPPRPHLPATMQRPTARCANDESPRIVAITPTLAPTTPEPWPAHACGRCSARTAGREGAGWRTQHLRGATNLRDAAKALEALVRETLEGQRMATEVTHTHTPGGCVLGYRTTRPPTLHRCRRPQSGFGKCKTHVSSSLEAPYHARRASVRDTQALADNRGLVCACRRCRMD